MCYKHKGKTEQHFTESKTLVNSSIEKKNPLDFLQLFQTFSRSGKLLGKFQDFFKNSRLCMNTDNSKACLNTLIK